MGPPGFHTPSNTHTLSQLVIQGPERFQTQIEGPSPNDFTPMGISSALSSVCMFHVFRCCILAHVPAYLICSHVVHAAWVRAPCMSGYTELSSCFILQGLILVLASSHEKEKTKFLEVKHLLFSCVPPHTQPRALLQIWDKN